MIVDSSARDARPSHCPACGELSDANTEPYRNTGPHENDIFDGLACSRCARCGSGWCDAPAQPLLTDYYRRDYEPARMAGVTNDLWPVWDERAASLITLGRVFGEFRQGEMFVDVGPGAGSALGLATLLLPKPRLGAVEFNEASIAHFRRHAPDIVITSTVSDIEGAAMIYSSHSLEHFSPGSLDSEIAAVAEALRPGGVFVVEVPLGETSMAGHHTPHLLFFSPDGLRALLERHGFSVPLCFVAEGRMKPARERMAARFERAIPAGLENVRLLRVGDLVPAERPYNRGNAIKAFAIKA